MTLIVGFWVALKAVEYVLNRFYGVFSEFTREGSLVQIQYCPPKQTRQTRIYLTLLSGAFFCFDSSSHVPKQTMSAAGRHG